MPKIKNGILLFCIVIFSFSLRIYDLDKIPNSISADEAAFGYNAYSVLKTGRDEFGHKLPLLFQSFDDHKNPVFAYLLVPFIKIFGLNDFAIRLPSVLAGTATVIFFFFLTRFLVSDAKVALTAAFFAAFSPWLIQYSRIALETQSALLLTLAGICAFFAGTNKRIYYFLSAVLLGFSFWTYYASKLFILLFLPVLLLFRKRFNKSVIVFITIFLIFTIPYFVIISKSNELVRQYGISVFSGSQDLERDANYALADRENGIFFGNIIHNRRLTFINLVAGGFLRIINLELLFSPNDQNQIPATRLFYLWQLPLLVLGAVYLYKKRKVFWFIVFFLLIGYIPGAITQLPVFDRRILINSYPLILLSAIGLWTILQKIDAKSPVLSRVSKTVIFILIITSFFIYSHNYFLHGRQTVVTLWGNGMKETIAETMQEKNAYENIFVSLRLNQPLIFFLYYLRYPPDKYLSQGGTISGGYLDERNRFDTFRFKFIKPQDLSEKNLYVWSISEIQPCLLAQKTVYTTDGKPLSYIGKLKNNLSNCKREEN